MTTEQKQKPIEYEQVTVKVPKLIMDYLRKTEDDPKVWLEETVVDSVRAELEGMTGKEWIEHFKLGPVFKEVLDETRFQ